MNLSLFRVGNASLWVEPLLNTEHTLHMLYLISLLLLGLVKSVPPEFQLFSDKCQCAHLHEDYSEYSV